MSMMTSHSGEGGGGRILAAADLVVGTACRTAGTSCDIAEVEIVAIRVIASGNFIVVATIGAGGFESPQLISINLGHHH